MNTRLLFLYGTLKRGCSNHGYMRGQRFVAEARTEARYRLHDMGGYPGMVSAADGLSITGEIWEVDDEALARLDVLEDIEGGEYVREKIPLLPPHDTWQVEGYRYQWPVTGRRDLGQTW